MTTNRVDSQLNTSADSISSVVTLTRGSVGSDHNNYWSTGILGAGRGGTTKCGGGGGGGDKLAKKSGGGGGGEGLFGEGGAGGVEKGREGAARKSMGAALAFATWKRRKAIHSITETEDLCLGLSQVSDEYYFMVKA